MLCFKFEWKYNKIWERGNLFIEFDGRRKWVLYHYGQRIENMNFLHELQNAYLMMTKKHLEVVL